MVLYESLTKYEQGTQHSVYLDFKNLISTYEEN